MKYYTRATNYKLQTAIVACLALALLLLSPITQAVAADPVASESVLNNFHFQVPYPGLTISKEDFASGDAIGVYIAGIYKWFVAFGAILAMLAFVYAGVLWLTSRGNSSQVGESKKVMVNALVGTVLLLGSYTLLWAVNPDLVKLKTIKPTLDLNLSINFKTVGACCYNIIGIGPSSEKLNSEDCKKTTDTLLAESKIQPDPIYFCADEGKKISRKDMCWESDGANLKNCTRKTDFSRATTPPPTGGTIGTCCYNENVGTPIVPTGKYSQNTKTWCQGMDASPAVTKIIFCPTGTGRPACGKNGKPGIYQQTFLFIPACAGAIQLK